MNGNVKVMSDKNKYKINSDIEVATTIHSDYYTNDDIFTKTVNSIFSKSYHLVAHKRDFNNQNILPVELLPDTLCEPLLLTKDNEKIVCLSNVCTHRGHLVCEIPDRSKSLVCRYHGRRFNLDGTLNHAIGFDEVKNFPTKKDDLDEVTHLIWNDFIFASLDGGVKIEDVFKDIDRRTQFFPYKDIRHSDRLSSEFIVNCHWSIYCENYLEGFHVTFVHKGLASEINNETYKTEILNGGVLQYASSKNDSSEIYGLYYWIFPNLMLNFYDWGLSVNIIEPISKDRTRVRFLTYPIKDDIKTEQLVSDLKTVELEDQAVVHSVQKGIKSRYYKNGRYSAEYEKGVHYFHTLLSKYI